MKKNENSRENKSTKGLQKAAITNCAGLAIRTYGIAVGLVHHDDYKCFIASCAGTSPWLALNGHDTGLDPQFKDILQALFAWKQFI